MQNQIKVPTVIQVNSIVETTSAYDCLKLLKLLNNNIGVVDCVLITVGCWLTLLQGNKNKLLYSNLNTGCHG